MFGRDHIEYKSPDQVRLMRRAGLVVAEIHTAVRAAVAVGVTTAELDAVAAQVLRAAGATSSLLGYEGYPATICVSVNDEVIHGIPGDRVLRPGDVVSVDAGAIVEGWHGDAAFSVVLPGPDGEEPDPADVALVETTERATWAGIAALAGAALLWLWPADRETAPPPAPHKSAPMAAARSGDDLTLLGPVSSGAGRRVGM